MSLSVRKMRKMRVATSLETNRDREIRKLSNLLENAVAKNDTRSLKTLLTAERYEAEYLEGLEAIVATNVGAVQLLLDHVESRDVNDVLWLMFSVAAEAGRAKFMRLALAVKLRDRSVPSAALRWAAEHGHNDWIKQLLDNGADVNSTGRGDSDTALCAAVVSGHIDCLTTLIQHGADVNAGTSDWTSLHCAAHWNRIECVTALLRHGADINIRNRFGDTALHTAAMWGRVERWHNGKSHRSHIFTTRSLTSHRNDVGSLIDLQSWLT